MTAIFRTIEGALWERMVTNFSPTIYFPMVSPLHLVHRNENDQFEPVPVQKKTYRLVGRTASIGFYQEEIS